MVKVQVAVKSKECAARIRRTFQQTGDLSVQLTASADKDYESVVVMDHDALDHLRTPVRNPGRVVLIARNDTEVLARAWKRGILSVVLESDSADTLLLAIESAALRIGKYS
jgi:DNA-binding NarL/FixJ family response regulator